MEKYLHHKSSGRHTMLKNYRFFLTKSEVPFSNFVCVGGDFKILYWFKINGFRISTIFKTFIQEKVVFTLSKWIYYHIKFILIYQAYRSGGRLLKVNNSWYKVNYFWHTFSITMNSFWERLEQTPFHLYGHFMRIWHSLW